MRRILGCFLVSCLALPLTAAAQPAAAVGRAFVSVYGGSQRGDGASTQSGTFSIYEESGTFSATQSFDGASLLSIGGGVRVWGNLAVGGAFSRTSDEQAGSVTVTAPHPLFFATPRTASLDQPGLKHEEAAFHLQALYVVPVGEKFELVLGGGPSFISVKHDFLSSAGFAETGSPFSAITVTNVKVTRADKTATGFNVGAEATFFVTRNLGVGGFVRWAGAKADLDTGNGNTVELDLGGPQFGGGVRVRF